MRRAAAFSDLEEHGFEVIGPILTATECTIIAQQVGSETRGRAGSRRLLEATWCQELVVRLRQNDEICARLPAPEAVAVQCTLFSKSPGTNWLVAPHQDLAIPVKTRINSPECSGWSEKEGMLFVQPPMAALSSLLAVRLHLDDSSVDNGALRVVPGSHTRGRVSASEADSLRKTRGEVICAAPLGSVLLMRPLLLHASSKAATHTQRRVLHFLFGPRILPHGLEWHTAV